MTITSGRLTDLTIRSRALLKPMRLHVYLPPGYDSSDRYYPVVYLLHPWGADERYWTETLRLHEIAEHLISVGAIPPFIAVMPQGDKSFFINAEDPGGDFSPVMDLDPEFFAGAMDGYGDYGDYMIEDVIPWAERKLRIRPGRASRVIAGVSMGGAGAAVLAFTHPDLFSAVGVHSPMLYDSQRLGPPWIFGLGDPLAFARRDPIHLAQHLDARTGLRIYLDCGREDEHSDPVQRLHRVLLSRGVHHVYERRRGTHSHDYWRKYLAEYLGFYAAGW
ncbi:MAG TPA: alpha/beta hydrolase-fold protein [Aggregatilineales bacterium]|mgnify:CR=1 FL=1|nr:esterase family protein [Chloroflexota bacterium]HQA66713.1 alpha/beta hydrolase-fold protein [Aggregatilineales bacterium]HQE19512.1 alpha/beta hydrolase-fold protein [Aggregatilineales bacterium]